MTLFYSQRWWLANTFNVGKKDVHFSDVDGLGGAERRQFSVPRPQPRRLRPKRPEPRLL